MSQFVCGCIKCALKKSKYLQHGQGVSGEHQQGASDGVGAGGKTSDADKDAAALGVQTLAAGAEREKHTKLENDF
eukprot:4446339-Pyramimonas_sp.AAC.2